MRFFLAAALAGMLLAGCQSDDSNDANATVEPEPEESAYLVLDENGDYLYNGETGVAVEVRSTGLWVERIIEADAVLAWADASNRCQNLELAGSTGWRLPTIKELEALYQEMLIEEAFFGPVQMESYWSSDTYQFGADMGNDTVMYKFLHFDTGEASQSTEYVTKRNFCVR